MERIGGLVPAIAAIGIWVMLGPWIAGTVLAIEILLEFLLSRHWREEEYGTACYVLSIVEIVMAGAFFGTGFTVPQLAGLIGWFLIAAVAVTGWLLGDIARVIRADNRA